MLTIHEKRLTANYDRRYWRFLRPRAGVKFFAGGTAGSSLVRHGCLRKLDKLTTAVPDLASGEAGKSGASFVGQMTMGARRAESTSTADNSPRLLRSGTGPGILLLVPQTTASLTARADYLTGEGYHVQSLPLDGGMANGEALHRLRALGRLNGGVGIVAYGTACRTALALAQRGGVSALVLYDPQDRSLQAPPCPTVVHLGLLDAAKKTAGPETDRPSSLLRTYAYPEDGPGFADPDTASWNAFQAGIAYSRSLALMRRELGPHYDLDALWDRHLECEFVLKDATENMKTMVPEPYVNHVPTMTGGVGHDLLKRFYTHHFIGKTPPDRRTIPISRTVGVDRIIEEKVFCFTHTEEIEWLLPGVAPTGKYVEIALVVIVTFQGDKLCNEHIYWDQASILEQIGLIDATDLPVAGIQEARKLLDHRLPSNELMPTWSSSETKPV